MGGVELHGSPATESSGFLPRLVGDARKFKDNRSCIKTKCGHYVEKYTGEGH